MFRHVNGYIKKCCNRDSESEKERRVFLKIIQDKRLSINLTERLKYKDQNEDLCLRILNAASLVLIALYRFAVTRIETEFILNVINVWACFLNPPYWASSPPLTKYTLVLGGSILPLCEVFGHSSQITSHFQCSSTKTRSFSSLLSGCLASWQFSSAR